MELFSLSFIPRFDVSNKGFNFMCHVLIQKLESLNTEIAITAKEHLFCSKMLSQNNIDCGNFRLKQFLVLN
jgi:hypothetical protein